MPAKAANLEQEANPEVYMSAKAANLEQEANPEVYMPAKAANLEQEANPEVYMPAKAANLEQEANLEVYMPAKAANLEQEANPEVYLAPNPPNMAQVARQEIYMAAIAANFVLESPSEDCILVENEASPKRRSRNLPAPPFSCPIRPRLLVRGVLFVAQLFGRGTLALALFVAFGFGLRIVYLVHEIARLIHVITSFGIRLI
ncbi:hypothetical protein SAMN05518855_100740 [Paenibacillus sp. CF384]|nr:hypothetical protein SAMN05518855_100740 [Paenibacillus sp. CF384]